jgi:hypothetical protein
MRDTHHQFMPKGALRRPTMKLLCQWMKESWSRVREDVAKPIKKCGISSALDVNDDHLIYEEDNDDVGDEKEEENSNYDFQGFLKVSSVL